MVVYLSPPSQVVIPRKTVKLSFLFGKIQSYLMCLPTLAESTF